MSACLETRKWRDREQDEVNLLNYGRVLQNHSGIILGLTSAVVIDGRIARYVLYDQGLSVYGDHPRSQVG